jgi:cysteine desulfurase/selenocysteine lyase
VSSHPAPGGEGGGVSGRPDFPKPGIGGSAGSGTPPLQLTAKGGDSLRFQFPMLARTSRGKPIIYLDSAASAQKPQAVLDAINAFYAGSYANIHRGVYEASERATLAYAAAREAVAGFLGGVAPEEIVFVRGTTEAINLVAQSFLRPSIGPNDWVLVSEMEHHANIVPWQLAGARTVPIPLRDDLSLDLDAAARLMSEGPRLLAIVHASNALGTINPVARLAEMAKGYGVPVLVDGAQAVAHRSVNPIELGADFYCFSAHKLYGPTGAGVLWARKPHLEKMSPYQGGGDMIDLVDFDRTSFAPPPRKFEAGTPDIAAVLGMAAAIEWFRRLDHDRLSRVEGELHQRADAMLREIPGVKLLSPAKDNVGIINFVIDGAHPHDIASLLDQDGICVRAGHHCTQPLHRRMGVNATVRASIAAYTIADDIDALVASVRRVTEVFA